MSYDPDCEELARGFLDDDEFKGHPEEWVTELAQHIQDAIELWLFGKQVQPAAGQDGVRGGVSGNNDP